MPALFETSTIKSMTLRNRLVRSATWEGMCDTDGRPTSKLASYYANLAKGGIGLIITGYTFVSPEGKQLPGKMGIHTDETAADHQGLTQAVHAAGGIVAVQLVHAGGQTEQAIIGRRPLAPSAVQVPQFPAEPAEMTIAEIEAVVSDYGKSAARAKAWGYDGLQLHGAHGYLINQFLSPLTNQRRDAYGGPIEKRGLFLMQVYEEVRRAVGRDYPVMIKLNADDCLEGGLNSADARRAARKLDEAGIDAIEISSGTGASGKLGPIRRQIDSPEKEAYNLDLARGIKAVVSCPVMVVGGFRSLEVVEKALEKDQMDYIALSRPLIREPNLPERWRAGDRRPATCISCNKCFVPGTKEGGIYCVADKKEKLRAEKA